MKFFNEVKIALSILLLTIFFILNFKLYKVNGTSLTGIIEDGEYVLVWKHNCFKKLVNKINREDVIIFELSINHNENRELIKKVVGIEGDYVKKITCSGMNLYDIHDSQGNFLSRSYGPYTVPKVFGNCYYSSSFKKDLVYSYTPVTDGYYCIGTGEKSTDSRTIGTIIYNSVKGEVILNLTKFFH